VYLLDSSTRRKVSQSQPTRPRPQSSRVCPQSRTRSRQPRTSAGSSFNATLNVLQTNALSLLAPFLLARSRPLKTNPYACPGVMVQASSSGRHDETEGPYPLMLVKEHQVQICLSGDRRMFGFPFEYAVSEIARDVDFELIQTEGDVPVRVSLTVEQWQRQCRLVSYFQEACDSSPWRERPAPLRPRRRSTPPAGRSGRV
jgi:hypothetical protein